MKPRILKKPTIYEQALLRRKTRMYLAWFLATIVCVVVSLSTFDARFFEMVDPQIKRAYIKMNELLPTFAESESSVEVAYQHFEHSRQEAAASGIDLSEDYVSENEDSTGGLDDSFTLEWVTQLGVGNRGSVVIANRDSGEILADSDASKVAKTLMVAPLNVNHPVGVSVARYRGLPEVDLKEFGSEESAKDIKLKHMLLFPGAGEPGDIFDSLQNMMYGSIVSYDDMYIACGIDIKEYLTYMARAVYIDLIVCVLMWLLVHYVSLVLDRHEMDGNALRMRLTTCTVIMVVVVFGVSWYVQVLGDVTSSLNAMESYAQSGVDNIEAYEGTHRRIDDWLDGQYLTQCRIACDYVNSEGIDNIDRQDLDKLSQDLGVMHIYVYDEQGRVVVTNSPYDHFELSDDPEKSSYEFRILLEGADHVIQSPRPDEVAGIPTQFIGVSRRNDQDLADGFVQVAIDPSLRDLLCGHLSIDSVLANMTVGQPEVAMAFNKGNLTVAYATEPSLVGQSLESFEYTEDKLKANKNGFFYYGYETYCVGFGESDQYYLVPASRLPNGDASSAFSLRLSAIVTVALVVIMVLALYKYQTAVVDAAPALDEGGEDEEPTKESLVQRLMSFFGLSQVVRARDKRGFKERWNKVDLHLENTPERKTFVIACRLLLVFCVLHLLPLLYGGLFQGAEGFQLTGLSYVISGNWEKGVNIFAFTSCLILLFALYAFMMVSNRILYAIAKVSGLRTETVCLLLRSSLSYFCVVAFIYYGLSQFGIPTQALLASVGIITLAVSVGAKDLVNDIIAGFFILLEGDLKVGDYISVGGWNGSVQEIGLRTTKVFEGKRTKICNNSSLRDVINTADVTILRVLVPIGLQVDLAEVEAVLKEVLPDLMSDVHSVLTTPAYDGIISYNETQAILSISMNVKSNLQDFTTWTFNNRIKQVFDSRGIAMAGTTDVSLTYASKPDETQE